MATVNKVGMLKSNMKRLLRFVFVGTLILIGVACTAEASEEKSSRGSTEVSTESLAATLPESCESVSETRCRLASELGALYLDDFDPAKRSALVVDVGGPGIAPGVYEGLVFGQQVPSDYIDHQVVIVGESFGVVEASGACLDALGSYITDFGVSAVDTANECGLQQQVDRYTANMVGLLQSLEDEFGYDRIDVIGGSFAGARWQLIASSPISPKSLRSVVVISPLQHQEKRSNIANWQAAHADRVWSEDCVARHCAAWLRETRSTSEGVAALLLMSRSEQTKASVFSALETSEEINLDIISVGRNQMLLGSAGFASQRTLEYFVGMCATIDSTPEGVDSSVFATFVSDYHRICEAVDRPSTANPAPEVRICFIGVADDPVVPPLNGSTANGHIKIVDSSATNEFVHGSISAAFTAIELGWCQ